MKKNLAILPLLALLAGACTNPLDYQSHVIWLSNSTVDKLFVVKDAELTCYINDEFVAKAIPVRPTEPVDENFEEKSKYYKAGGSIATAYLLKATIKPGDKVRPLAVHELRRAESLRVKRGMHSLRAAEHIESAAFFFDQLSRNPTVKDEFNILPL